jgi:oligopeptidase B
MATDTLARKPSTTQPFVDVISTLLDKDLPLTVSEWEEWGNPFVQDEYQYMLSYSPYDNVQAQDYPNILLKAGLNDPRVRMCCPHVLQCRCRVLH